MFIAIFFLFVFIFLSESHPPQTWLLHLSFININIYEYIWIYLCTELPRWVWGRLHWRPNKDIQCNWILLLTAWVVQRRPWGPPLKKSPINGGKIRPDIHSFRRFVSPFLHFQQQPQLDPRKGREDSHFKRIMVYEILLIEIETTTKREQPKKPSSFLIWFYFIRFNISR